MCVCVFGFNVAFNNFSHHITTVSGCDRELNAHFYSAASLKYHVPDTWHDATPSLGRPVLVLPRKSECQARMDGWVRVLHPFNSISVISRRWKGEHERLCAMKRRLGSGRISPPAGFEPLTLWSEVGSTNRTDASPSEEQLVPFFTTLVCHGLGSNPWPPVPRSGHSTNWAIGAGS